MSKLPYPYTITREMTDIPPNAYALVNGGKTNHAGDLPPITSCDGYSWMCVYLQQLRLEDVIGRSVIVHGHADDFSTQPSGNSGEKIACGIVEAWTL